MKRAEHVLDTQSLTLLAEVEGSVSLGDRNCPDTLEAGKAMVHHMLEKLAIVTEAELVLVQPLGEVLELMVEVLILLKRPCYPLGVHLWL